MKKTAFNIFATASLLLIAAGCQQTEFVQPAGPSHYLTATVENHGVTKSQLGRTDEGKYYAFWTAGDELAVYVDGLSMPDKYVLSRGAGSEKGVFGGTVAGNRYVALYPYSDRVQEGLKDNVLSLELPEVQEYSPDSFGEAAFPMLAVSEGDELQFRNLCAALKVSMTGDAGVKSITFLAHDERMPVSGPATVRTDFSDAPALVMSEGGPSRVKLDCKGVQLSEDTPTDFYIVIPAGTYEGGFSVEVETFAGTFTRKVGSDVTFSRSQLRHIAPFRCDADGVIAPDDIPYNQIWYWTDYEEEYAPAAEAFDRKILSNVYKDGKGVITFDGPVKEICVNMHSAFTSPSLTRVILPNSVEVIGDYTFTNSGITEFHVPDNLRTVGVLAFNYCNSLTRIYGSLASPDEKALVLKDGTMVAYAYATMGKDLVIPDGVKTIVPRLFLNYKQLETVTFPKSIVSLGELAFGYCTSLKEFKGDSECVPDGHAFVNPSGELVAFAGNGLVDYVVPEEVENFPYWIFSNNTSLHSITFPKMSFNVYYSANYFQGCDNLEFLYGDQTTRDNRGLIVRGNTLLAVAPKLPADYRMPGGEGVTQTNENIFWGNQYLQRVTLPDDMMYTGAFMFGEMPNLKAVQMPADLVYMGNDAFYHTTGLDTLYLRSFAPPMYDEYNSISYFGHDGLVICVPEGYEDQYKSSEYWAKYSKYIRGWHYDDLEAPDYYISTDYSRNGEVKQLQKATKGQGIDIVLMGDAFSDRQIADGTYAAVMDKMMEAFFSEEPYTSHRDYFNVYSIVIVSSTEGYDHAGQALGGWFGEGTQVGGNDQKCFDYALSVIPQDKMDDVLIIVAMNSSKYAGTCWMYYPSGDGDYSSGASVAYFPAGMGDDRFEQLVHHEAGGHGFVKLTDEYAYEENSTIPQEQIDNLMVNVPKGWWKNGDFTDDPAKVKWARFLADERYRYDGLGCFEGAFTYWKGAWRPTENSIMRYNVGGFNAPSREAIWYRIHKLAYGAEWTYDYEEFVAWDALNRKTAASSASPRRYAPEKPFTPTAPPVVVPRRWNDPVPDSGAESVTVR